jgi:hypothetical protein
MFIKNINAIQYCKYYFFVLEFPSKLAFLQCNRFSSQNLKFLKTSGKEREVLMVEVADGGQQGMKRGECPLT